MCCIFLILALLGVPALAYDCGCGSGSSGGDAGTSDTGGDGSQDSGTDSGDSDSLSEGEDSSGVSGSQDSSDSDSSSSDSSGDSDNSGAAESGGSGDEAFDWYSKARQYSADGLYNESLSAFNTSISMDPTNKRAWMGKGELLMELGYFEAAGKVYQRVIVIDPAEYEAYFMLGEAFFSRGMYEDSIAMYDRTLAVNPSYDPAATKKALAEETITVIPEEQVPQKTPSFNNTDQKPTMIIESSRNNISAEEETEATPINAPQTAGMMPYTGAFGICVSLVLALISRAKMK